MCVCVQLSNFKIFMFYLFIYLFLFLMLYTSIIEYIFMF